MAAVDNAVAMLAADGIVGVADFYTSAKFDTPNRQHPFARRWFWKAVFDLDNIDLSPERRHYLEHQLEPGTAPAPPRASPLLLQAAARNSGMHGLAGSGD
jgi:hypothetical protein